MNRIILCAALAVLTLGCSPKEPKPKNADQKILRINIQGDPVSLDPRIGVERRSQVITNMLFEGLTRVSDTGKPAAGLAERIEISRDGLTYTFHLRVAHWSTGQQITAHDFEHSWKRALEPDFDTSYTFLFQTIKGAQAAIEGRAPASDVAVRAIDARTLVVELEHPTPYFLDLTAIPALAPIPAWLDQKDNSWSKDPQRFVCNGPFQIVEWKHDRQLRMVKNHAYWDADAVALDGITISIVDEPRSVLHMFEKGELDWVGEPLSEIPQDAVEQLSRKGCLEARPVYAVYMYDFNTQAVPFNSEKVRRAFAGVIDRQAIIDNILKGSETAAQSILPPGLSLRDERLFKPMSREEARRLFYEGLEEIGLAVDKLGPITLSFGLTEGNKPLAQAVQQQWQEAFDVRIELDASEWKVYLSKILAHDFQIAGVQWYSWVPDPVYNLERQKYGDNLFNGTQWADARYTQLLEESDQELDQQRRRRQLQEAEEIIMAGMPCAPVFIPNFKFVRAPGVEGVMLNELGQVDFKNCRINDPESVLG